MKKKTMIPNNNDINLKQIFTKQKCEIFRKKIGYQRQHETIKNPPLR